MTNWWTKLVDAESYRRMQLRHPRLWKFVFEYVEKNSVSSVLEVGCGDRSRVRDIVDIWVGIDINEMTDAIHQDFTVMDLCRIPKCDMLLACNVVEHMDGMEGCRRFFDKVKQYGAEHTVVSFFNRLDRTKSVIGMKGELPNNKYAQCEIEDILDELKLDHLFVDLGRTEGIYGNANDCVLVIK